MPIAIIISSWSGHPSSYLDKLLATVKKYPAGLEYDLILCANGEDYQLTKAARDQFTHCFVRENRGFNIGAWEHAWRQLDQYNHFLFLQDDCFIIRNNWLKDYMALFSSSEGIGLVGENSNKNWDISWQQLGTSASRAERATKYYSALVDWGIEPGAKASHITTVVQFTSRRVLELVDGFHTADDYQLAIATEIGFSKKVEAAGFSIKQLRPYRHQTIGHPQWPSDAPTAKFWRSIKKRLMRLIRPGQLKNK